MDVFVSRFLGEESVYIYIVYIYIFTFSKYFMA